MHREALKYLKDMIGKYRDNVQLQMVYKLLQKTKIVPIDDANNNFLARCYLINGKITINYNNSVVNVNEPEKLWDSITIPSLAFLLAHEACHVLYGDFEDKYADKDQLLINIAMDARINPTLIDPDFAQVSSGLSPCLGNIYPGDGISGVYDIHDRCYSVNEIYELLLKKKEQEKQQQQQQQLDNQQMQNQEKSGNDSMPSPDSEEGSENESKSHQENGNSTSMKNIIERMCNGHNIDTIKIVNENSEESDDEVKAEVNRLAEDIAEEVAEELSIPVENVLKSIERHRVSAKVKSNWERVIRKYVQGTGSKSSSRYRTYSRPNKRIPMLPGHKTLSYRGMSVFLDVSGSMDETMQKAVDNISVITQFNNGISTFIGWDDRLKFEHYNVNNKKLHDILNSVSGGCTDLLDGFEYFVKKSPPQDILVIISDLYTDNWKRCVELLNNTAKKRTVIIGLPDGYNRGCHELSKVILVPLK